MTAINPVGTAPLVQATPTLYETLANGTNIGGTTTETGFAVDGEGTAVAGVSGDGTAAGTTAGGDTQAYAGANEVAAAGAPVVHPQQQLITALTQAIAAITQLLTALQAQLALPQTQVPETQVPDSLPPVTDALPPVEGGGDVPAGEVDEVGECGTPGCTMNHTLEPGATPAQPTADEQPCLPASGEQPVAEQPVVEQPVAEQPVVEQPVAEQPVVEQPVAEQPVIEVPAETGPIPPHEQPST